VAAKGSGLHELATRYAGALFELAEEQESVDAVADDLARLRLLFAESAELRQLVRNPTLSRDQQLSAVEAVLAAAEVSALTQRFAGVLATNRRLYLLDAVSEAFLASLAQRRGEVTAHVIAAQPLSEAQVGAITEALTGPFGSKLKLDLTVQPDLLGGLVVKVGSQMIDSSLRTKIDRLQQTMKAPGGTL